MHFPLSEKERREYYYGLPSQPVLVAKSNDEGDWYSEDSGANWPHSSRKRIFNVGQHRIIDELNKSKENPLREKIVDAVKSLEWNCIDIVRIGYERDDNEAFGEDHKGTYLVKEQPKPPVVLLVTVEPNTPSATWGKAHPITKKCKEILDEFGIDDIHCEVKEGKVHSKARLTPADFDLLSKNATSKIHFSDNIRAPIAPRGDAWQDGMKGLYVRLHVQGEPDSTVLLTTRHVALPSQEADEAFWVNEDENNTNLYQIIQPTNATVESKMRSLIRKRDKLVKHRDTLNLRRFQKDQPFIDAVRAEEAEWNAVDAEVSSTQLEIEKLEELKNPDERVTGHVMFSPHLKYHSTHENDYAKADYALIRLDQDKHDTALNLLDNRLHIGNKSHEDAISLFRNTQLQVPEGISESSLLRGKIPQAELFHEHSEPLLVGKCGNGSNLTFGYSNEVKSLRRYADSGSDLYGEEWCIIGIGGSFAKAGDSGAVVWEAGDKTDHRRIGGLIISGCGSNKTESDVNYAIPIEGVIDDIQAYGYQASLIGDE
jgi:hypothetical protein